MNTMLNSNRTISKVLVINLLDLLTSNILEFFLIKPTYG